MGVKGSTHFMDAEVAEVNKFHNKLAGQEEAYATSNGVASSCRQGGAILVKGNGSGSVTAVNAEGKTATGTYKARLQELSEAPASLYSTLLKLCPRSFFRQTEAISTPQPLMLQQPFSTAQALR